MPWNRGSIRISGHAVCRADGLRTARLSVERRELDAQEAEELNRRLVALIARLSERPEVTIEYFVPDERKAGGAYVTVTGVVRHIPIAERVLVMEDETAIPLEDIDSVVF